MKYRPIVTISKRVEEPLLDIFEEARGGEITSQQLIESVVFLVSQGKFLDDMEKGNSKK